jgi:hypothetical protein
MKYQLPYCKTSEAIKGYTESVIARNETNDCVVRAIASSFGIDYDQAHKFVKKTFNREDRKGTYGFISGMNMIATERIRIGRKTCKSLGKPVHNSSAFLTMKYDVKVKGEIVSRNMTVGTFIKKYPNGTYILNVSHHVFTVKNGVVIGNIEDSLKKRVIVYNAWKVGK